ncbi:hypothetical protein [uncultured Secundilactobacillus sp.]|uniref:hypothetical protein n=1 Tax=uncultured Secundilactobacillus sp. TaxID=2813935 RepID=UPI00258C7017|nr:hypothetical protein [uncultured Secundilactobacillus sp.]
MKKRRKKWRKGTVPNDVFVTLSFDENDSQRQDQIQAIIADFTKAPNDEEPPLVRSFPAASLPTAEQLLAALKKQIVDEDVADIKVGMTLNSQYFQGRKTKVTKILEVDWTLSYDFDNLSVPLLQDIFNNPDYISDDYAVKAEIAQSILTELEDVVPNDHLAVLPTEEEADENPVKITTRTHAAEVAAAKKVDPTPITPTTASADSDNESPQVAPVSPKPVTKPVATSSTQDLPQSRKVIHAVEADTDSVLPQVSLPYFDVSDLPVAAPEDAGYVPYALNERRKQYNQRIKQLETRLTQDVRRRFQLLNADYERDIKSRLQETRQALTPDTQAIKTAQIAQLQPDKERQVAQATQRAETQKAQEIALAQQQFEAAKQKAEQRAAQQISHDTAAIEKNFAEKGTAALKTAIEKAQQAADKQIATYEQQLNQDALGEQQAAVSEWLADSAKVGQQLLESLQGELHRYERQATQTHLDAMQTAAAKHNTEINLQEVHHQAEEVENLKTRLQAVQDKNLALQGTNQKLQNNVTDMKEKLLEQATNSQTQAQQKEQAGQQEDLLKLFLMKQLGSDDQPAPKMSKKPWLAAVISGLTVLILSGGGFAGYAYVNEQNQQQVTRQNQQQQQALATKIDGLTQQTQKQSTALTKSQNHQQKLDQQLRRTKKQLAAAQSTQSTMVTQPNREVTITWPNNN